MPYEESMRLLALEAEANTWNLLEKVFHGEKPAGTLQVFWGAVGMTALRAGTATTEAGVFAVQCTQMHFAASSGSKGMTQIIWKWEDIHKSRPPQEVVFRNRKVSSADDCESYATRFDACVSVDLLLPHVLFEVEASERAADREAQLWSCTSFTGNWEPRPGGITRSQEDITDRHLRVSQEISIQQLLKDYPNS